MATRNGGDTPEVNLGSGKTSLFLRTDEEKHQTPESSDVKSSSSEQKANFDSRFAPSLSEPQSSRESSALRWYHNTTSTGSAPTASPSNWREIALAQQKKNHDLWQHVRRLENQIAHFNAVSEESSATDNSKQKASEGFSGLELSQLRNNLAVVQAEVGLWKERSLSSEKLIQALEALVKQRDEENKILKQDLASLGQHLQAQSQHEIGGGMRVQQEPSASPGLQNEIYLLKAKFQRVQLAQQDIYHRSLGHVSCFHRAKYIPVVQSLTESSHI